LKAFYLLNFFVQNVEGGPISREKEAYWVYSVDKAWKGE
jgi:hypothetical protein